MGRLPFDGEQGNNHDVARTAVNGGEAVIYERRGRVRLEVRLEGETLWLTLAQMAELFGRDKSVVSRHLGNIFRGEELSRGSVVAENATTAADGKIYQVECYNLDAILSVDAARRGEVRRRWPFGRTTSRCRGGTHARCDAGWGRRDTANSPHSRGEATHRRANYAFHVLLQ